jgi:hypothetical protein
MTKTTARKVTSRTVSLADGATTMSAMARKITGANASGSRNPTFNARPVVIEVTAAVARVARPGLLTGLKSRNAMWMITAVIAACAITVSQGLNPRLVKRRKNP